MSDAPDAEALRADVERLRAELASLREAPAARHTPRDYSAKELAMLRSEMAVLNPAALRQVEELVARRARCDAHSATLAKARGDLAELRATYAAAVAATAASKHRR